MEIQIKIEIIDSKEIFAAIIKQMTKKRKKRYRQWNILIMHLSKTTKTMFGYACIKQYWLDLYIFLQLMKKLNQGYKARSLNQIRHHIT